MSCKLSPAIQEHLNQWNLRYPPEQKRSGVFEALRVVQAENQGYLSVDLMDAVAEFLGMPKIAVYEIATFYSLYHLNPVGRHVIDVCTNISCSLNGSSEIVAHLKKRLGIELNETTPDGKFTLREVECLGACIAPPVCQIGHEYHERLTVEKVDGILNELDK
jgi:NADH-quinone oxidoreductase subunit E